jgi:hypothetical protein
MNSINNQIDISSRRNILDAFQITKISWYGNESQVNFLGRLFDLKQIPSYDYRYSTAEDDILKHTVMNDDWPDEWVFTDNRFNLLTVPDQLFLDFLCLTIHPAIRSDKVQITTLLEIYNNNLSKFGFEINSGETIAGKPVYKAREIEKEVLIENSIIQKRLALVIGCSDYEFAGVLKNTINDATAMGEKLKSLGFDVIHSINPSQKNLKISIDDFGDKLDNYDVGLFFFSGHGVQVKGYNYIIPVDANLKSEKFVELDCVEANRVLNHMEVGKSTVNIVILDACRDNPFERSWGRGIGLRGLTTMSAPIGSLIAYSTAPGNTASDGEGENGLYTEALLKHIDSKNLSITSMFQKVRRDVLKKSNNLQTPWESTPLTADYYFNP